MLPPQSKTYQISQLKYNSSSIPMRAQYGHQLGWQLGTTWAHLDLSLGSIWVTHGLDGQVHNLLHFNIKDKEKH